jgi:hypothetical protein
LFGKNSLGGDVVGADAKNEGIVGLELCDTSLVRGEFLRSTTGECGGEKRYHHGILSFIIGERHFAAGSGR